MIDQIHFGNESSGPGGSPNIGETNITKYDMDINGSKFSINGGGGGGDGGGSGTDVTYWLNGTTCFTPTLCISNKYMVIGAGAVGLGLFMTMMKK